MRQPRSRRQAVVTISCAALAFPPEATTARIDSPASTWAQSSTLLREHAVRFLASPTDRVFISSVSYNSRTMRGLAASVDLPAFTRVASYPVEVVADDEEFDDTYAVRVYRVDASGRKAVDGVSGIPLLTPVWEVRAKFASARGGSWRISIRTSEGL